MCRCAEPDARFDQFREWRSLPADETEGRFADVSILECVSCGHLWVRYHVEYEGLAKSGRWARGRIHAGRAASIRSEEVPEHLAELDGYLFGGSRFDGASGTRSGAMPWGP
jgi:hypothetical protein